MDHRPRPLSPSIQVYRPQLTSVLSITHRLTGVALGIGSVLLVSWLIAADEGPQTYVKMQQFLGSPVGLLLLLAWTFSLMFHLANGIRHLFWDLGLGFRLRSIYASGWAVIALSLMLTLLTCLLASMVVDR